MCFDSKHDCKPLFDFHPFLITFPINKLKFGLQFKPEELLANLLDSWIDKIDMIVHPERRKLTALALISFFRFKSK